MRALLDACVLYPTVMREMLLGAAGQGLYEPLWSDRLLEEWARAAARFGPLDEAQARGEIALLRARWPKASVTPRAGDLARLWLPDEDDIHVLAAAIAGSADTIVTLNARDFPRQTLAEEGLARIDPDALLYGLWLNHPNALEAVGARVLAEAERMDDAPHDRRRLLKKARLPRLAKALAR
ncbi:RSP_2648 family PIN domain-containing protein [Tropicimonas sp. IMCC6043]|uniref:RSP_2648 family PIN domain-containing protein n=1 Tax=Tropicimonas sp. IMCC6043 TaxID=2510645 RepID=UPI00101DBCE4|nr:PIN domain-containing protein [Tropicimonas sp. IMCC6043]RYH10188.1 PIN domain-containing protein [Tropicimonas sp. IMCC6043]